MTKYYLKTNCILLNFANDMAFTDKFEKDEYYLTPEGYIVFTEKYHLKRGYCCQSGCRHCPGNYNAKKADKNNKQKL